MRLIENQTFAGERPLYRESNICLKNVRINMGESAVKECRNVDATECTFDGYYPIWKCVNANISHCTLTENARAALWYNRNSIITDCTIHAPKTFREMDGFTLSRTAFTDAKETLWHCKNGEIDECSFVGDYLLMHSENIKISNLKLDGKYSFQYCKNIEVHDSDLNTKDAFWDTENVTIYDSTIRGEYLAWNAKRLTLVRCHISGTQPLCYCEDLKLIDCTFDPSADLAFEYSSVEANIIGSITSVKNPTTGHITATHILETIIDDNILQPADCIIKEV